MNYDELRKMKDNLYQKYLNETLDLVFDGNENMKNNVAYFLNSLKCIDEGNGLYFVYNERTYKYLLYNQNKDILVGEYDEVYGFFDGYAKVSYNDKYFFIDKAGNVINSEPYDDAHDFHDGVAWIKKDNKWYLINKENRVLTNCDYDDVHDFH